ncbi:hypothetical protein Pfo_026476 [Paulownia fortunei]|nr:hypothetical protein Pfo_026476 [Paulownia fortunei]
MGCFLACFGFKKKKKRRKPGKKSPSGEQNHGSYVPLDSDVSIKLDIKENNITSDSYQLKEKPKEPSILKIKKKVSFNLNVKAYEPIPNDDDDDTGMYLSDGEEETKWEFNAETKSMASLHYEEDSIASSIRSHPASYRYQNCRDSYDEEDDELKLEENNLNFDDIEDSDEEVDDVYSNESDDGMPSQEDFPWELNPVNVEADNQVINTQIPEEKNRSVEHIHDLQNKELQGFKSKSQARDRSQYVFSVLNPVENLSQWKVVKAKAATPQLKCQKENLMSKQEGHSLSSTKPNSDSLALKKMRNPNVSQLPGHTVAVDASLSNWLGSLETQTTTKNSSSGQRSNRNTTDI